MSNNYDSLTDEEIQFVLFVCQHPGEEPPNWLKRSDAVWENPARLGLIHSAGSRRWVPTNKVQLSIKIKGESTQELVERETLLERIDATLKGAKSLEWKYRYSPRRIQKLRTLRRHLVDYQDSLLDQQVTLRQMCKAIDQELGQAGV